MTFTDTDLYAAAGRLISRASVMCDDDTTTIVRQAMESLIEMMTGHAPGIDLGLIEDSRPLAWPDVFTDERGL